MATLRLATKEALESHNVSHLSEIWVTNYAESTGKNWVADSTGDNADFEKGFVAKGGAFGWHEIGSGYYITDKYSCFGARCVEINSSSGPCGLISDGGTASGVEPPLVSGDPITLSIYAKVLRHAGGKMSFKVIGFDGFDFRTVVEMDFGIPNEEVVLGEWVRYTKTFVSAETFYQLKFEISSENYNGHILIDRPQMEKSWELTSFENGREYTLEIANVLDYSTDEDRTFSASSMRFVCSNPNGIYSYDRMSDVNVINGKRYPLFDMMNKVVLKEGIVDIHGEEEWWTTFTGYIEEVTPSSHGPVSSITVECVDALKHLMIDFANETFEPEKVLVQGHRLSVEPESDNTVFHSGYENWAKEPLVSLYIGSMFNSENKHEDIHPDQYTIDYARGIVYFNSPVKLGSSQTLYANFYYYKPGTNTLGEVIRRICRKSGFYVGEAFDENDNYTMYNDRTRSIDIKTAGEVLLDFYDPRIGEMIEPQVPPTTFKDEDSVNYLEAIEQIRRGIIAPNFILRATRHGVIQGYYAFQKQIADNEIILKQGVDFPISDDNIYTHVKVYGRATDSVNMAPRSSLTLHPNYLTTNPYYTNGSLHNVIDGSDKTQFVVHWNTEKGPKPPSTPFDFVTLYFSEGPVGPIEQIDIDGVNPIQLDRRNKGTNGAVAYRKGEMAFTIKYSMDGKEWWNLCNATTNFTLPKNARRTFTQNDFGENVTFRYLRFIVEQMPEYEWEMTKRVTAKGFCIGLGNVAIWGSSKLLGEARADGSIPGIPNLIDKMKVRTFVVPEDPLLDTQEKVDARAVLVLREFVKGMRRATIDVIVGSYLDVGETVLVREEIHGVNRLFFIESIQRSKNGNIPLATLGLVSYS